ncbi:MAG: hypothetical protein ACRER2_10945, partial [Methylococcales bacterium]
MDQLTQAAAQTMALPFLPLSLWRRQNARITSIVFGGCYPGTRIFQHAGLLSNGTSRVVVESDYTENGHNVSKSREVFCRVDKRSASTELGRNGADALRISTLLP